MNPYFNDIYKKDVIQAVNNNKFMEKLKGSSILITGASGLICSFMTDMLLYLNEAQNADIKIYATGRNIDRLKKRYEGIEDKNLFFVEYDVNKKIDFDFPVDYIIHGASNAYPAAFSEYPVETILSNIMGTHNLLNYGKNHSTKRLLFISSGEVYGQIKEATEDFKEDMSGYVDQIQVRSCYPASKRAAETLCSSYTKEYGLDTVVVRPCHCYGANVTASDNRATVQFMNNVINGDNIVMKSLGRQLRSYIYVADCASGIFTVLVNGKSMEAYNISNKKSIVTIAEFAENVAMISGKKVVYDIPDDGTGGNTTPITRQILNSEKLESLGYEACYDIRQGIKNTYNILKTFKENN